MNMKCRVDLETKDYHMNLTDEKSISLNRNLEVAVSYCVQIIDLIENNELELYKEEAEELQRDL